MSAVAQARVRRAGMAAAMLLLAACNPSPQDPQDQDAAAPRFVGSGACSGCHRQQFDAWQQSHHALAMQVASRQTVLGDFDNATLRHFDTSSTFFSRDGHFLVRTENAAGELQEFQVGFTFGVSPLQQYLVEFPGGRLQVLPFAWDARAAADGGQRWFHLYPDEQLGHDDPLHWTGREQNWNYMCAECHSTRLEKNYDPASDSFATTWSEISVGCEACHGPASAHVAQAENGRVQYRAGLLTELDDSGRATWQMKPDTGIAARSEPRLRPPAQPEACGRCHSRRAPAASDYRFGRPLLDTHTPSLLEEGLYFADGQIRDEVYVYGSFVQSRMYQAGVTCSDCHEPHSATLRGGPSASKVCDTCHLPSRFAVTAHHRHDANSVGCVDCHMASRNYMIVDGRRDHSFRIPRPDLTIATGAPNACNQCHSDREAAWAEAALLGWYGARDRDHFALGLHSGRHGRGNQPLLPVIANNAFAGIARATALSSLRPPYSQQVAQTIQAALRDPEPLVRLGALRALGGLQPDLQADWAAPLLSDSLRALRIAAARVVSPLRSQLHVRFEPAFRLAEAELIDALQAIAERPDARVSLGEIRIDAGDAAAGEADLRNAIRLAPRQALARSNLADLYRRLDRDADAEKLLREGLELDPGNADYRHALGLLLVRSERATDGLEALREAATLQPDNARYQYVYAVALNSLGQADAAIDHLAELQQRFPAEFDIHWALATMLRDRQRFAEARGVAENLAAVYPGIPPVENLLRSLP